MKKRIALHLALLASAAGVFTATAVAKFTGDSPPSGQTGLPSGSTLIPP